MELWISKQINNNNKMVNLKIYVLDYPVILLQQFYNELNYIFKFIFIKFHQVWRVIALNKKSLSEYLKSSLEIRLFYYISPVEKII